MARSTKSYFAHQESLRCQLLRRRARQSASPMGRDTPAKDQSSESFLEEPEEDPQSIQPEHPHQPDPPKSEPFWRNPHWKWRSHPAVLKYDDEAFIFINADAFPTDSDATAPLIAWLRQPGKMCSPSRKQPLPSGVVRVEDIGWVVTLGHMPGAIDRMARLLEKKAGQVLMFKGKRFSMAMDIHMPLEWMP